MPSNLRDFLPVYNIFHFQIDIIREATSNSSVSVENGVLVPILYNDVQSVSPLMIKNY